MGNFLRDCNFPLPLQIQLLRQAICKEAECIVSQILADALGDNSIVN